MFAVKELPAPSLKMLSSTCLLPNLTKSKNGTKLVVTNHSRSRRAPCFPQPGLSSPRRCGWLSTHLMGTTHLSKFRAQIFCNFGVTDCSRVPLLHRIHLSHSKSLSNLFFVWNDVHTISSQGAINPVWGRPGLCNSPSTSIQTYRGSLSLKDDGRCHARFWIYLSSQPELSGSLCDPCIQIPPSGHNRTNLADPTLGWVTIRLKFSHLWIYGLSCFPSNHLDRSCFSACECIFSAVLE